MNFVVRDRAAASPPQTDDVKAGLRTAAGRDIRLSRPVQPRGAADCLNSGRASGHQRSDKALDTMSDRDVTGREVHKEGGYRKGRQSTCAALVYGAYGLGHRYQSFADPSAVKWRRDRSPPPGHLRWPEPNHRS